MLNDKVDLGKAGRRLACAYAQTPGGSSTTAMRHIRSSKSPLKSEIRVSSRVRLEEEPKTYYTAYC